MTTPPPAPPNVRPSGVFPQATSKLDVVLRALANDEKLGAAVIAGKVAIGLPLCLIGPFLVSSTLLWFERALRLSVLPGAGATFVLAALAVVPLMLWYDRRTHGRYLSEAVHGEENPFDASSYGEFEARRSRLSIMTTIEIALTGPRLLNEVIDAAAGRSIGDPTARDVAARLVLDLLAAGQGVNKRELVGPGRSPPQLAAAVKYLLARDWVGQSTTGDRVWLLTTTRDRLLPLLRAAGL